MREFGGKLIMSLLVMRLSASVAQTTDACERLVVEVNELAAEAETHSGRFYLVGEGMEFKPLFRSEGDYVLQFVEDGDEYFTYDSPEVDAFVDPSDKSLEDNNDLESVNPRVDVDRRRRHLQACGYWAIGMKGVGDIAMYPMIKVADCADHPADIDVDSVWFRQRCHDCPPEEDIGQVTVSVEPYECGSYTFPPTPAPATAAVGTGTPAPVEADSVDPEPNSQEETTPTGGGAGKLGAPLGVAVAVLGVAAHVIVIVNTM